MTEMTSIDQALLTKVLQERFSCWSCGQIHKGVFAASHCCPPPKAYWCKQHQRLLKSHREAHKHLIQEHTTNGESAI